ncbi:MAG: TRAP transporter substrate-binding protein DctP [Rhizobacter sp.]|nr:TRAP transporter substrate-binding protein DctP [Bacteriovorax sp.]
MKTILLALTLLATTQLQAAIKVGVLAPEGTGWAKNIKLMASEIKDATKGNVEFKIYYGGSQGDEVEVLRKIRLGQLQGGIFTGKTLGEISGDVRVIEIPFTFNYDREKAVKTLEAMEPFFDQKFAEKKYKSLATFEIGQVYFVTQKKVTDLNQIKSLKIWSWDGDPIVTNMFEAMNLNGVPLALPDVLQSLSTGVIDAAYAPPIGMIALQWNTKVKYMIDFPVSFSIGAFVITSNIWNKVSPADQKATMDIAKKYEKLINSGNAKDNADALAAMKDQKIEFVKFSDAEVKVAKTYRDAMVKKLTGKLFSADSLKRLNAEMAKK